MKLFRPGPHHNGFTVLEHMDIEKAPSIPGLPSNPFLVVPFFADLIIWSIIPMLHLFVMFLDVRRNIFPSVTFIVDVRGLATVSDRWASLIAGPCVDILAVLRRLRFRLGAG